MIEVHCNLCGQNEYKVRFPATLQDGALEVDAFSCTSSGYGSHAQIVECVHCGYVYANPRWDAADILDAYTAVEDDTYVVERVGRELTFSKHLKDMEKFTGPGNGRALLDVGAYIGVFVEVAQNAGWQACGIEPSAWAVRVGHQRQLPIIHGTLDAPELQGKQFQVITMWDVIEHVADPSAEIHKAYQLLAPGGWLVVHTMDIDSRIAKVMGARWPWLMDMHIHYFSQRTLGQMLQKNGFSVVWSGAQGRYMRLNYLVTRIAGLNRTLGKIATKLVHGLHLSQTAVPVNFGDLFTVYAQRPL